MSTPLVQIALDFPTIDEALRVADDGIKAGVDILLHCGADQRRADAARDTEF